jgi:hypothetical protein
MKKNTFGQENRYNSNTASDDEASRTIWSCYMHHVNLKSLPLFISLQIDCFLGPRTRKFAQHDQKLGFATANGVTAILKPNSE